MFKRICSSFLLTLFTIITFLPTANYSLMAKEESNTIVFQSVDDDIAAFDFDYERYYIDPALCYRPIIINFNESLSKSYYDLLYVYDPNNLLDKNIEIKYNFYASKVETSFINHNYTTFTKEGVHDGTSSDGKIKRYCIYTNNTVDKIDYVNRQYVITNIDEYEVYSIYKFDNNNELEYSNQLNIKLEDAHNWSYHFDEDSKNYNNFIDAFIGSDSLKDQMFYSFSIPKNWDINEIKSIDIRYKEAILAGYRHNVADEGIKHEWYQNLNDLDNTGRFYSVDDFKINDSIIKAATNLRDLDDLITSEPLGYSVSQIGNKLNYKFKTIYPDNVSSNGVGHSYFWNKILSHEDFRKAFMVDGNDGPVYEFAKQYFTDESKDYYVVNYDSNQYFYGKIMIPECQHIWATGTFWFRPKYKELRNYLKDKGVPYSMWTNSLYAEYGYYAYLFVEEYTFDISATSITYVDNYGYTRSAATSVAPVMQKEGSGGGSEGFLNTTPTWVTALLSVLATILVVLLIVFAIIGISKIMETFNAFSENNNLRLQRKSLKDEIKKKEHGKRK